MDKPIFPTEKFTDAFPFEYVGGGYFRRKGQPKGVSAPTLHGMDAVKYCFTAASQQKDLAELKAAVREYLSFKSADGKSIRQELRAKLSELCHE